jgi:hypothetical protein
MAITVEFTKTRVATASAVVLAIGSGWVWFSLRPSLNEHTARTGEQTPTARVIQRIINPMPRLDVPPEVLAALTEANFKRALAAAAASPDRQAIIRDTNPIWAAQIVLSGDPNSVPSATVALRMQGGARNVMQMAYSSKTGTVGTDVVVGSELKHNDEDDPKFAAARAAFKQAFQEIDGKHD